ncbi:unnamed protein product [Allacma fusca]|uniref:Phospholipid-transporting ATPase n=1 Tax=Allacma fusca TaxID=39272 RepID=A0A8J2JM33_9HEXA|nr:unnamed protein product [Allacma fusca]
MKMYIEDVLGSGGTAGLLQDSKHIPSFKGAYPKQAKPPFVKTQSLGIGTSAFGSETESHRSTTSKSQHYHEGGIGNVVSSGGPSSSVTASSSSSGNAVLGQVKLPPKSALRGHSRSASHGGVIVPKSALEGSSNVGSQLPSALKKGHTRAASHGQIVDDPNQSNLKAHSRAPSKTEFILPPGHVERDRVANVAPVWGEAHWRGHSRQASRSESIYTLRQSKVTRKNPLFFWRRDAVDDPKTRTIVPNHCVPPNTPADQHPNGHYPNNHIRTTKYTAISFLPKNLFEQFHRFANLYFISIVLLNWIPAISAFGKEIAMLPVMFVLGVTALKDLFEDRRRHLSDKRINNSTCRIYKRELGKYSKVKWKEMRVGDLIHLSCDEMIPADILVLRTNDPNGLCYIETSNLDGESNLKQREVIRGFVEKQSTFQPNEFKSTIEVGPPTTKIYHFTGSITHPTGTKLPVTKENLLLRDCILKNTDFVEGIVVYAGRETKAMLNNGGPRHKRTGLERMMNTEVVWCVVILTVLCVVGATGYVLWLNSFSEDVPFLPTLSETIKASANFIDACLSCLTFIIILQVMIPLSLYVTIELTKLMQIYHIQNDIELYDPETQKRIECRAMNIPEDLGQIQYVFSDKTGTLTENKMLFRRCVIEGVDYNHPQLASSEQTPISQMSSSPPIKTNPLLSEILGQQNIQLSVDSGSTRVALTSQAQRTHDFFMILAVCNTVVVAKYPHHDKMNASGFIVESGNQAQYARLSPIRETVDSSLPSSVYTTQDHCNLLMEYQPEPDNVLNTSDGNEPSVTEISTPQQQLNKVQRRPRLLDKLPTRPLSPISSSNETTPTESPAQRPRFLQIPPFPLLSRFSKTFNNTNQPVSTPTPSPSEFRPIFEAESPDELALVEAAYAYNCKLLRRTPQNVRVSMPGEGLVEYEILHSFPFDSVRKRMSIILKHPVTKQIILYCKGADSAILPRLKHSRAQDENDIINQTQTYINSYAREGLRILVMAKRILTEPEYLSWLHNFQQAELDMQNRDNLLFESYNQMENNLELVGATGIEDRLQDGVPESIESLRKAGIVVWVLTGDKQETAVNIAYSCKLFTPTMDIIKLNARSKDSAERTIAFYLDQTEKIRTYGLSDSPDQFSNFNQAVGDSHVGGNSIKTPALRSKERALVVDGRTLTYILDQRAKLLGKFLSLTRHCSSVLCCRATPLQKAYIVQSVKDQLGMRTLAIGDGANDVSMIQRADVGIGISGKEGMQAVMASDFAISKFRYLERLLLVHGHWCYDRLARMILYFFYKNAAFVFVIFWYQLLNGWSGSVMIDQMYLMVYNLFFTALPPMAIGIYDQDASADLLLSAPRLYRQGRLQKVHQAHSFWLNMLDSLYQSVVIFFVSYGAYNGSDVGMFEFGTTIVVACMLTALVHMAIEAKSWTIIHVFSIVASITIFYTFVFIYNTFCISCLGFENPFGVLQELVASPVHWLTIVVTIILAVLPRLCIRCLETSLVPSDVTKALLLKRQSSRNSDELFVSWSRSTSNSSVLKDRIKFPCVRSFTSGRPEAQTGKTMVETSIPTVAT